AQATIPWIASIAFSLATGRSIFLERCLIFAQIGLFGAWSVAFRNLPRTWTRLMFCCLVAVPTIYGTASYFWRLPSQPPALEKVAGVLAAEYRPGDVVIVDSPGEVNRIRYYAARAGLRQIDVKCKRTWEGGSGHVVHLASLEPADIYSSEAELFAGVHGRI